jgi:hypothetical protein
MGVEKGDITEDSESRGRGRVIKKSDTVGKRWEGGSEVEPFVSPLSKSNK